MILDGNKMALVIVVIVLIVLVVWIISIYNGLVKARNKVKANWAQIDVALKRRSDLIPNLVETVKGYASHEKDTLDRVIHARNTYVSASLPEDKMKASGELTQALNKLMMLSEAYPDLKANTNFIELQNELTKTEDKIAFARQFYNDSVYAYDNKREMFPSSLFASLFGFESFAYFEVDDEDKQAPKVNF